MQDIAYDPLASVQAAGPPGTISFIYGLPDPATFPVVDLRRAADRVLRERPELALQYGPEQGYGPLIDYLRDARALLAEHAHGELVDLSGRDYGKNPAAWGQWLEEAEEDLVPVPWRGLSEPVAAWGEPITIEEVGR